MNFYAFAQKLQHFFECNTSETIIIFVKKKQNKFAIKHQLFRVRSIHPLTLL